MRFMNLLKSIAISFSLYSKIPMPVFTWDEDNYRHAITFLPLIGGVIGLLSYVVVLLASSFELPVFVVTILLTLIPLIVTGGFHVDGFMDVQDALHSYQDKEKKLEIMKDPHIGAFAVIGLVVLGLFWTGALYMVVFRAFEKENGYLLLIMSLGIFPLVRAFCGITSILFKNAKKEGMLNMETGKTGKMDIVVLAAFGLISAGYMIWINAIYGCIVIAALALFTFWYKTKCEKEFGGVTGDTAGFYIVAGEAFLLVALAVASIFV